MNVTAELTTDELEAIAQQAAEIVLARISPPTSPYLTTVEAAAYLSCPKSRIYDLRHRDELPVFKDGSRNLFRRDDLDAVLKRVTGKDES